MKSLAFSLYTILVFSTTFCSYDTSKKNTQNNLPPQTIEVISSLINLTEENQNLVAEIIIDKIIGYGASSIPIVEKSVYKVLVNSITVEETTKNIEIGSKQNILLKSVQGGLDKTPKYKWELIQISK